MKAVKRLAFALAWLFLALTLWCFSAHLSIIGGSMLILTFTLFLIAETPSE